MSQPFLVYETCQHPDECVEWLLQFVGRWCRAVQPFEACGSQAHGPSFPRRELIDPILHAARP